MKPSPFFLAFPRWLTKALFWLLATAALIFGTMAAAMYFWLLPNIADYRDKVAELMTHALGQRVTLEAVDGSWQQTRPQFILRGVRLYDEQDRPALYLERLEAAFAWRSLLVLQPRFTRLELTAPALTVRRARDGHFYVGGIPINPGDTRSGFSDWLLKQGQVHIRRATLAWRDEVRQAPVLILRELDFTLENSFNRHVIHLQATPPAHLSMPIRLQADLKGRSVSNLKTWSGEVRSQVSGISLSSFSQWIDLPYAISRGWGAANLLLGIERGRMNAIAVGLNARDMSIILATGLPAVQLAHLRGSASWKRSNTRQQLELQILQLNLPGGKALSEVNAGYTWDGLAREAHAQNLNLTALQSLWPSLPMPAAVRDSLQDFAPRGQIDALQLRWQGERPNPASFNLLTRFTNLQFAARGSRPGVTNLSGNVRGDEKSGVFEVKSKALQFDLPEVFREPVVALDSLQARGTWKKRAKGMLFNVSQLDFANTDAAGSGKGSYETENGHSGKVDITARLTRANGNAVYRYLPKHIHDHTVAWVKRAVIAGTSRDTRLTLKGDLGQFPFINDQGGVFQVTVGLQNAVLDYVEGWPRIEGAAGQLIFHGSRMEVHADQGRIFNVRLGPVNAVIPNLHTLEPLLEISGQAAGDASDFIRFSNQSPVGVHLKGITNNLGGSGSMALALNLKIPLHHAHDTTLGGRLSFRGDTLLDAALPRIEQVKGDIVFTQVSVSSQGLAAQILGGPVSMTVSASNGRAQLQAQGQVSASGLSSWIGKPWGGLLSGETRWRGQLVLGQEHPQLRIESDLVGLESHLPAPLHKPASQPMPLVVTRVPQAGNEQLIEIQLGRTLGAIWQTTADNRITRGELHFGGAAKLPSEPGLHLTGSGRGLALSEWLRLRPENQETSDLAISFIDLSFATLDLMGRRFPEVRVQGRPRGGQLRLSVTGRDMNGTVVYRPAEKDALASSARVTAQFKQLTIPPAMGGEAAEGSQTNMKASDVPVLDLSVEDFRLENQPLGRLEATAHGTAQGLVIDNLQLVHPDSVLHMSGLWRDTGNGETQARLQLEVADAGKMLARFGFKDALKRGSANLEGEVTWDGGPVDFDFQTLAGTLNLKARNGQFLKVDPGVAKLLGVLSLQALPRRLTFDFRDIFNEGFAFDEISATMRIARGVVYSDDFHMKGPAAKVNMSGMAKLTDETVQLRVKVTPKLSGGVAVAGALIGGPIAGLGVLAAQKLFRDPFEEASSREYMVTGPWREPEVTKLTKTPKHDASKDSDG